jgi:hypothetical protein
VIPAPTSVRGTISTSLFFKYVKSKLTPLQQNKLEMRLRKLRALQLEAKETGQQALLEIVETNLLTAAREQLLLVKGFKHAVRRLAVDKFRGAVENVLLRPFAEFPRPVPKAVKRKLKVVSDLKVFDHFEVLFTDYTQEPEIKSTAKKVREKDPILFGVMNSNPDILYLVADWVDEHCDLNFEKLVERYRPIDIATPKGGVYQPLIHGLPDLINPEELQNLTARVQNRLNLLSSTRPANWREKEAEAKAAEKESTPVATGRSIGRTLLRLWDNFWRG